MSEFECRNGHIMKSGEYICSTCGAKLARTDGMNKEEFEQEVPELFEEPEPEEEIDNS